MSQKYKKQGEQGLFGEHFRLGKISKQGDPLEKLNAVINWDVFVGHCFRDFIFGIYLSGFCRFPRMVDFE